MKKAAIDIQLHMAVKTLAILEVEIDCNLEELIKKANLLQEKEEVGEEANCLLEMISNNLHELVDLFGQRKNLRNQIEKLKRIEKDLME